MKRWLSRKRGWVLPPAALAAVAGLAWYASQPQTLRPFAVLDAPDWPRLVVFSPDGRRIATGSGGKPERVLVWDVATKKVVFIVPLENMPSEVLFTPDGTRLVARGAGHPYHVWDLDKGTQTATLPGSDLVATAWFSAGGETLTAYIPEGTVHKFSHWDVATWQTRPGVSMSGNGVTWLDPFPGGRRLAVGTAHGKLSVWDVESGQEPRVLRHWGRAVGSVAAFPDGRTLAESGSRYGGQSKEAGVVNVWNVETGERRFSIKGYAWDVAVSPDGRLLYCSGSLVKRWVKSLPAAVQIWFDRYRDWGVDRKVGFTINDARTGEVLARSDGPPRFLPVGRFSPDGKTLAVWGDDEKSIKLYDLTGIAPAR